MSIALNSRKKAAYNNTFSDYPKHKALPFFLNECAKKYPGKIAINFNGRYLTYSQLYESSNKLARLLIDNNIKPGDVIALALDRSVEMVISLLAILKSGAVYVPLDPEYPKDRIEFMLNDSAAKILLTSRKYHDHFISDASELLIEDAIEKFGYYSAEETETSITGNNLAYILYTSGSTGKSKGVQIRHYSLVNLLLGIQKELDITSDDKLLAVTTISFDIAGADVYLPLISGAQLLLADSETAKDGRLLFEIVKNEGVSVMQATPFTWRMMLEANWDEKILLKVICTGEQLPKDLAARLIDRCKELWNLYGPTETTIWSSAKRIINENNITIGKPIANTQIYILDNDLKNLVDGSVGEIYIGGDGVAPGYLNRPELTSERFVDDPFSGKPGDKMYRTGDLGKLNENADIQCLGRIDNQVKVRGYRIELEEIEYALVKQLNIKEAVVVAREDTPGNPRLAAYIVLTADAETDDLKSKVTAWRKGLLTQLPEYMVPDDFVIIDAVPLTPSGKRDRKALPKPDYNLIFREGEYAAPGTETEKQVSEIWQELMGLEKISIYDNFFEIGGRSLVAVRIMARIEKLTGKRLPIASLFSHPTIKMLAALLAADQQIITWDALVPIKPAGTKTPLYIIHGDGLNVLAFSALATYMDTDQPVFGLQAKGLNGIDEPPDNLPEIARQYVREIISHNPAGPYIIAGYSFGGYIAVEMRKQITAMGKKVKMLIMLDTEVEKTDYKAWYAVFPKKVKRHLPMLLQSFKLFFLNPVETIKKKSQNVFKKNKAPANAESEEFFQQIDKISAQHWVALKNYEVEPFDDKVYLFKAKINVHNVDDTEFLGWKKYAKRGVEKFMVPGDHLSILLHPNAEALASILQHALDSNIYG